jgi:uncharacterized protein (TIGR02246 family)
MNTGCAPGVDVEATRAALLQTDKEWAAAVAAGDIQRVLTFWADDAVVYFPGAPSAIGKEAIREMVKKNRKKPGFSLAHYPAEAVVSGSGELGYTLGTFQLSLTDPEGKPISRNGHYLCIWEKHTDGSWKCSIEISNFRPATVP